MKTTWLRSGGGRMQLRPQSVVEHERARELNCWSKSQLTRLVLSLLAILAFQTFCYAKVTKLPVDDQKALHDVSRFHEVPAVVKLPPVIFSLCADYKGRLADPGQKWEATDAISDDKLPTKRLIWAFTDGEYYVVHYERGGIGHSFHVLVAKLKAGDSKPSFVWYGVGRRNIMDYSAFLDAVDRDKLDDRRDYAH